MAIIIVWRVSEIHETGRMRTTAAKHFRSETHEIRLRQLSTCVRALPILHNNINNIINIVL